MNAVYQGPNFQTLGIDDWDCSTGLVEAFRTATGVTYPLCMFGSATATAWGVYNQGIILDGNGIVRFITPTHILPYAAMQDTIDVYLAMLNAEAPQRLTIGYSGSQLRLRWLEIAQATSYRVYASDTSDMSSPTLLGETTTPEFMVTGALVTRRFYSVTAILPD